MKEFLGKNWGMLVMITVVLLAIIFVSITKVHYPSVEAVKQDAGAHYWVQQLTYVQDKKTGLCYAYFNTGVFGGPALANVPCTDAVLRQIAAENPAPKQ